MAETERVLLNHYHLPSLDLDTWPAEHDVSSDDEEDEPQPKTDLRHRRSKSRYSALGRSASHRSSVPGTEKSESGIETMVQKDEQDPLGNFQSVVQTLRQRGLPVEEDLKLRNRFLLSSTTFSPGLFLSQVHSEDSTENLLRGLDFLSRSIEQKSASLKVLVESNFERFVRAKATIDNVYTEMREQGREAEPSNRRHSRHISRHGNQLQGGAGVKSDKKKNALLKESDFGVQGIKTPLLEVAVKAQEVWGPALGGREKEGVLKALLTTLEKNRGLFEVAAAVQDCIRRKDHEALVEEYTRAYRYAEEARNIVDTAATNQRSLSEIEVNQVLVTARMWSDIEEQVTTFKRDVWRRLTSTQHTRHSGGEDDKAEEHMELIHVLLELGVEDNPIWVWLLSRYDHLKNKITATSERTKVEVEILRRHLAQGDQSSLAPLLAQHLRQATESGHTGTAIDSPQVLEFWEHVYGALSAMLSVDGGILGEVVEYWETAQSFIEGKTQRRLPPGIDGQSRKHHSLPADGIRDLQAGTMELVNLIRDHVFSFFSEPPIEDISLHLPTLPPTPNTPGTPISASLLSPLSDTRFKFDTNNVPLPSPKKGETWEKYAFWPPHGNSLSGAHYLSKSLALVGNAASEMASLSVVKDNSRSGDGLKALVGGVRERCVQAVCGAWNTDSEKCRVLEDWQRSPTRRDLTLMPSRFMTMETTLLSGVQKILYLPEALNKASSGDVVIPPSSKLLQLVRSQFVGSLYKTFSGMVENAESSYTLNDSFLLDDAEGLTVPARTDASRKANKSAIDASKRNVRILLTLSNLQALRSEIIPQLFSQFESNFSVKLSEESNTVRDVLSQIDSRLFQFYVKPITEELSSIIHEGVLSPSWEPTEVTPVDARPYVYNVLLTLVIVHTEVSTTAPPLTSQILKYLLEHVSLTMIDALKQRPRYSLPALMQATLDVEFMAQTLNNYTTDKASETQSAIYLALDERTDNDARMKLQTELSELRLILKRLREQTRSEFACFKRPRTQTRSERFQDGKAP